MSFSSLEIVQLPTGEIVVRRAGSDSEPLLVINFSDESKGYLGDSSMDVAKAMIRAGIESAFELGLNEEDADQPSDESVIDSPTIIH